MAKICVVEVFFGANDFADYFQREGRASDVEFNTDFHVFWADFHNMCLSVPRLCYLCLLWRLRGSYVRQCAVVD